MSILRKTPPQASAPGSVHVAPREIGYQVQSWWQSWDQELVTGGDVPQLRWPNSVAVYARMRTDSQVAAMLDAVTLPIQSTGWFVDPVGADPAVVALVADDLGLPVRDEAQREPVTRLRDRFSFSEHLRLALLELAFGHSVFEQVYRVDGDLMHLHKLAWRPPQTISRIEVARDGGLVAVEQFPAGGVATRIPVDRLVAYVNRREGGAWTGQSLLRRAWRYYVIKEELLRIMVAADQRNGMGLPVYEAMQALEGEDAEQARQAIADELDEATRMVKGVRAGDEAGVAIGPGAKLSLLGVSGKLPDILGHIRYCDEQIAASVLAHFLNLGQQSGTGSYALGSTFADFFLQSLQTVATQVADVINRHVIEDLVDLNFGVTATAPRLQFDHLGAAAQAQALASLAQAKILLPEPNLESHVRRVMNLPEKAPYPHSRSKDNDAVSADQEDNNGEDEGK